MSNEDSTDEVVVVVRFKGSWAWFRSEQDLWVLDWRKWRDDFVSAGYDPPALNGDDRFGIIVVNDETAESFLRNMKIHEVRKDLLQEEFLANLRCDRSWWSVAHLFPVAFVDFDKHKVFSLYPEGVRMERYVPDRWTGEFVDFFTQASQSLFSESEKFWIVNGVDLRQELINVEKD